MSDHSFFQIVPHTISELAELTNCVLGNENAGDLEIMGAAPLEDAQSGTLSFIDNPRYVKFLADTAATAVICSPKLVDKLPEGVVALVHDAPYKAYATALAALYPSAGSPQPVTGETGISARALVSEGVELEDNVTIEAGAVIGIGAMHRPWYHRSCQCSDRGRRQIGRECVIGACATVSHAYIGDKVILHTGVRIGQDGFGFAMGPGGHQKVAQIGRVIIQDKVEIGANSTIDRGSNRDTVIGEGTKDR